MGARRGVEEDKSSLLDCTDPCKVFFFLFLALFVSIMYRDIKFFLTRAYRNIITEMGCQSYAKHRFG